MPVSRNAHQINDMPVGGSLRIYVRAKKVMATGLEVRSTPGLLTMSLNGDFRNCDFYRECGAGVLRSFR